MKRASDYYQSNHPAEKVFNILAEKYGERQSYTLEELCFIDSFHLRGRAATVSLAEVSRVQNNTVILDAGSGPGGTARYLSSTYGTNVIGLDLTYEFSSLASILSRKASLAEKNSFICGNAVALPFKKKSFDCIWMEHVQMNIENKLLLLSEFYRVLKPGGFLSFYEVFQAGNALPDYPLPWSDSPESCFLISPEKMQELLRYTGFGISHWRNCYEEIAEWAERNSEKDAQRVPGVYLLMGKAPQKKIENFTAAALDNRLIVVEAVLTK